MPVRKKEEILSGTVHGEIPAIMFHYLKIQAGKQICATQ